MRNGLYSVFILSMLTVGLPAFAQATRTWVSGVGDDANPCSRTAPCKTWSGAISKTAVGGEIDALDPGGFGALTITKSITLDGGPGSGGILVSGTNGIIVNAGATDVVVIRNMNIQGIGMGLDGIKFTAGAALMVENCHIMGGTQAGIEFAPAAGSTPVPRLFVRGTTVSQHATGLLVTGGNVTLEHSQLIGTGVGLDLQGTAKATVYDTVVTSSTSIGLHAEAGTELNVERGVVANNAVGIQSEGTTRLSEVMVSHNVTGLSGNVVSFGNNRIAAGNGTDGAPSSTIPQQ